MIGKGNGYWGDYFGVTEESKDSCAWYTHLLVCCDWLAI